MSVVPVSAPPLPTQTKMVVPFEVMFEDNPLHSGGSGGGGGGKAGGGELYIEHVVADGGGSRGYVSVMQDTVATETAAVYESDSAARVLSAQQHNLIASSNAFNAPLVNAEEMAVARANNLGKDSSMAMRQTVASSNAYGNPDKSLTVHPDEAIYGKSKLDDVVAFQEPSAPPASSGYTFMSEDYEVAEYKGSEYKSIYDA